MDFKEGDLVFVHGKAEGQYRLTTPGSWGYVTRIYEEDEGIVHVEFERMAGGQRRKADPYLGDCEFPILVRHLKRIPNPPETEEEITELVAGLTKLTA